MTIIIAAKFLLAASIAVAGAAVLAFADELRLLASLDDGGDQGADWGSEGIHNGTGQ